MSAKLEVEQIQILEKHGQDFKKWLETDQGKKDVLGHREHEKYFKQKLSPENIHKLTESEFAEIWKNTWASMMWGNKDWYVKNKLIDTNGIENIRNELRLLLYGSEDFVKRYDEFRRKVEGFGVSIKSEFLNMIFPDKFCLWNETPRTVLSYLELDKFSSKVFKYRTLTGEQYLECVNYLDLIRNKLYEYGVKDFVDLDVFFWYISENIIAKNLKKSPVINKAHQDFDADKLEDLILAFDKDRDFLGPHISEDDAMKIRAQFVTDFPPDKILETKIDRYVIGKRLENTNERNRTTFCYQLEFGLVGFGTLGAKRAK